MVPGAGHGVPPQRAWPELVARVSVGVRPVRSPEAHARGRALSTRVAGVRRAGELDEQGRDRLVRDRAVLDPPRHHVAGPADRAPRRRRAAGWSASRRRPRTSRRCRDGVPHELAVQLDHLDSWSFTVASRCGCQASDTWSSAASMLRGAVRDESCVEGRRQRRHRAAAGRCRGRAPGSGPAGCRRSRTGRSPPGPGRAPPSRGRGCRARCRGRGARSARSAGRAPPVRPPVRPATAGTTSSSSHGRVSCACADRLWNETPSRRTESLMPAARAAWCAAARSSAGSAVGCGRVTDRVSVVKSANRTLATTVRAPPPWAVRRRSASSVTRSMAAAIRSAPEDVLGERPLRAHRLALAARVRQAGGRCRGRAGTG